MPDARVYGKETNSVVADITNQIDGIYDYFLDMDSYRKLGLQIIIDGGTAGAGPVGVTVTVHGTVMDDGTVAASCTYEDMTMALFGVANLNAAPGATNSAIWIDNDEICSMLKYVMVRVECDTNADSGDYTIYEKRLY